MSSPLCEKAINEALKYGNAILKFISPNDAGATNAHQYGPLLPKSAWKIYTPHAPKKGVILKHPVTIEWQDGRFTESVITWYGQKTRSEYRLTRFGKDFPYLIPDTVGDLLILIPKNSSQFMGYVLDLEEDIEEVINTLGVQPFDRWAVYSNGSPLIEDENSCLEKEFNIFAQRFAVFPDGLTFSEGTRKMLEHCCKNISDQSLDDKLLEYFNTEYRLFQTVERQLCQTEVGRLFKDIDDFLKTASSIMNRRKSRAGRSLENHIDFLLNESGVPHEMQASIAGSKPDIIIPSKAAYNNLSYPLEKLFVVGVKTTCKDRWRQVLNEGKRVRKKHILTLQPGISSNQLTEMHEAGITLIVPKERQKDYPKNHPLTILTLENFVQSVQNTL